MSTEITVILTGSRMLFYKIRNACLYLFGLSIICFLVLAFFESQDEFWISVLVNSFFIAVLSLIGFGLLSLTLAFRKRIGSLIFDESEILLKLGGAQIQVQEITLILNADRSELDNARSNNKGIEAIGSSGNFIRSKTLPPAHTEWELILSKEHKISLMALNDDRIKLVPQFESRPLIMQYPLSIFNAIAHLVRGH